MRIVRVALVMLMICFEPVLMFESREWKKKKNGIGGIGTSMHEVNDGVQTLMVDDYKRLVPGGPDPQHHALVPSSPQTPQ